MQAILAASDPTIPMNSGAFAAVDFVIPPGRMVSPQFPATVNHYFPTSHMVYNVVLAALGELNPHRAVAPSGLGTGAMAIGYGGGAVGQGDRPVRADDHLARRPPATATARRSCCRMNHFAPGTPVEIVETEYPIRVGRFELIPDSAGAGTHRGGIGFAREYAFLTDCTLTLRTANHRTRRLGAVRRRQPRRPRPTSILLPGREDGGHGRAGDPANDGRHVDPPLPERRRRLRATRWNAPADLVLADIEDGYVTRDAARELYGVAVTADGALDDGKTGRLRNRESGS